ncbi:Uncharacterised protein [Klebsiella pneumoniae]|nr:Uncharacterised protein [Klebsiella pneumoniae]SLO82210.1 Uncharacterised protein [Klebsiella pneumoniae]
MAKEGFGDGDHRDDRCHPGNDWRVKVVRQVRQNRDVLLFRRRQVCRREAQNAAEDEEHHGQHHHDVGAREDTGAFLLSAFAVLFTFGYREGRDDRRVVEGEDHHRDRQPQGHQQAVAGNGSAAQGERLQRRAVPLRDQIQSQHHQRDNEREHQHAHRFHNHLLAETHNGHHADNQDQRQNGARRRRHVQLVRHEGFDGVSDRHAINQQDRVDSEEIKQGNQLTCAYAEVFFHYFGDVFARVFPGQHEAGHAAVGEESHREGQNRHDDQGDHAANAGVDRQEQDARANRRAVQAQHPHGVGFTPSAAGFARNDGAGLSGFHLYLLEESTKSNE